MLEICVYLIEFAIIFFVLIAVISILNTPCIYFILYIIDIIFGNSYFKLIRSRRFKNIIGYIGNHCKLNRFSRLFNKFPHHEKDIYLRYNTPAYSFCFSSFNVCILMELFPSKYSELEAFIWSNIIYVLCYYIGMYRKLYDKANDKKFMAAIETNQEFLKLSFIVCIMGLKPSPLGQPLSSSLEKMKIEILNLR